MTDLFSKFSDPVDDLVNDEDINVFSDLASHMKGRLEGKSGRQIVREENRKQSNRIAEEIYYHTGVTPDDPRYDMILMNKFCNGGHTNRW